MGTYRVRMPQLGETVESGIVAAWLKEPGDAVTAGDPLLEVETDKVDTEIESVVDGTFLRILVEAGERVAVDTPLAEIEVIGPGSDEQDPSPAATKAPGPAPAPAPVPQPVPAASLVGGASEALSPLVVRMIGEHQLDIEQLRAFADGERVSKKVVQRFIDQRPDGGSEPPALTEPGPVSVPAPASDPEAGGMAHDRHVVPFTRIRRRTAEHMVRSKAVSPHVLSVVDVDYGPVQRARAAHAARFAQTHEASLSYLPFVLHAVARTLPAFPHLTASVTDEGLLLSGQVNLGVAVDLDGSGLIVPVIRAADDESVGGLAVAVARAADRARAGDLGPDDISGGTFTVTSQGPYGTLLTAPIINQPQVAILSVDGVAKRPVVTQTVTGQDVVAVGLVGHLALSWDHRAVDGTYAARFLAAVRATLEQTDWLSLMNTE